MKDELYWYEEDNDRVWNTEQRADRLCWEVVMQHPQSAHTKEVCHSSWLFVPKCFDLVQETFRLLALDSAVDDGLFLREVQARHPGAASGDHFCRHVVLSVRWDTMSRFNLESQSIVMIDQIVSRWAYSAISMRVPRMLVRRSKLHAEVQCSIFS